MKHQSAKLCLKVEICKFIILAAKNICRREFVLNKIAMEESFRLTTNYKKLQKCGDMLYFHKPCSKRLLVLNIATKSIIRMRFRKKINNLRIGSGRIFLFHENTIEIYNQKTFEPKSTFIIPNAEGMIYLRYDKYIFLKKNLAILYEDGKMIKAVNILYYQFIDEFLVLLKPNEVEIYQEDVGRVYSKSVEDFTEEFISISRYFEKKCGNLFFSLRNKKLYVLLGDRIVGHDLNIYLDELNNSNGAFNPDCFVNLHRNIAIFDKSSKKLLLMEKNMQKRILKVKCDDFVAEDGQLYVIFNNEFRIFEKTNIYKKKFHLVDENIKYDEREDEFDESDSQYHDFE